MPSGPDHVPADGLTEVLRSSFLWPDGKLRSTRLAPLEMALRTAVPVSSSEPAMRRAVPDSVTSVSVWPPLRALSELCNMAVAWVDVVAVCCATANGTRAKTARRAKRGKRTGTSRGRSGRNIPPPQVAVKWLLCYSCQNLVMEERPECRAGGLRVEGGLDIGGAVAVEADGRDGLGEDDADGDEDGAGAGSERHGDFHAGAFGILIAAAEAEAAFGQIFAHGNFFLKAAAANAGEDAGLDARAVAARNHALFDGGHGRAVFRLANFGLGFDPDGRRFTELADARDAFANFEGLQFELVEIDDFAALAEAAFHEKSREGFFGFVGSGEVDVPEVGARLEKVNGVEEVIGGILVDFGDHARASVFPMIAFEIAAEVELLAGGKFFGEAEDAAIAADEQGFRRLRESGPGGRNPRSLHGHAEADAVTLPESIG